MEKSEIEIEESGLGPDSKATLISAVELGFTLVISMAVVAPFTMGSGSNLQYYLSVISTFEICPSSIKYNAQVIPAQTHINGAWINHHSIVLPAVSKIIK
jgi:hypothetical protein